MDVQKADKEWNVVLLRYFNPIEAHKRGRIEEVLNGIPNNLMPYITHVAIEKREELCVLAMFLTQRRRSCVRDYIHVVDLAKAHVRVMKAINDNCI